MTADRRVTLRGVLAQTASSAAIRADGSLVVELYDFSDEAQKWLGNDVAFLLELGAAEKAQALARLASAQELSGAADPDGLLLQLLQTRFADYYDVKQWLEEQNIPFRKEFEPWA
jgi:hypothetical protein